MFKNNFNARPVALHFKHFTHRSYALFSVAAVATQRDALARRLVERALPQCGARIGIPFKLRTC